MAALEDARAAKAKLAEALAGNPAVNGIGIAPAGAGYELKVNLSQPAEVPAEVDGVAVRTAVVGRITPQEG
jgi:hypothetical protein